MKVKSLVSELFPEKSNEDKILLENEIHGLLEGKDIGRFKGDISIFKQHAVDTAARMPRPVVTRRGIEKEAGIELNKLVDKLEREMLLHLSRLRSDDPNRKISPSQFVKRMRTSLRLAYKVAYDFGTFASGLGRANKDIVTHAGVDEKKWLDSVFAQESKYFNKFLQALIKGESWKKARVRIKNYSNAVRSVYESSRVLQLPNNVIVHWVLQSSNPCPDCRMLHRMSPYTKFTLPTTPKAGSTRCFLSGKVPVFTDRGWLPIEEVQIGDYVLTHEGSFNKVLSRIHDWGICEAESAIELGFRIPGSDSTHSLLVTLDHKFLSPKSWIRVSSLNIGDQLECLEFDDESPTRDQTRFLAEVVSLRKIHLKEKKKLYCLEVESAHSFIVEAGLISHNCLSSCYCKLRVVNAKPAEVKRVASRNRSAASLIKKLQKNRKKPDKRK